jgi:hypothetical protein
LARLEHRFCIKILPRREVKCKPFAQSFDEANRLYFREVSAHTSVSKLSEPLGLVSGPRREVLS